MISATVAAWAFPDVDRSLISCPATFRFSEALNVAKRTVCRVATGWPRRPAA